MRKPPVTLSTQLCLAFAMMCLPTTADADEPTPARLPLAGLTIAIDPGHQLGNHRFLAEVSRLVPAGGFTKGCNSTGTSTDDGHPEATVNFRIARLVQRRLRDLGASVRLTRSTNSADHWGPCVDERGRFGAKVGAALMVSLHADGAGPDDRGFHVIVPRSRAPYTEAIAAPSRRLGRALRAAFDARGIPRSNYVGDGTALSVRPDLGTLNLSGVPVAMLEIGNMRNRSDARRMRSADGQAAYAAGIVAGIRRFLGR